MATRRATTRRRTTGGAGGRGPTSRRTTGGGGGGRRGATNGQRVRIDLPDGTQANVTERLRAKANFTATDPKKGPGGRYLGGAKGTKSIVLHFDSASSDLPGRKDPKRQGKASMAMPVSGATRIDGMIQLANQAGATSFTTPNGRTYPVRNAGGGRGGGGRGGGGGRRTPTRRRR